MRNRKESRSLHDARTAQQACVAEVQYTNPETPRDLSSDQLTSGLPYQRPVEPEDVDKLIAKWDNRLLTPLVVSFRDEKFNVVDGQHRIAAMRKMANGGSVIVPCLIYFGMTYEQEVELYSKLDRSKGWLRLSHATKALQGSGTDAEVLDKKSGDAHDILCTRAVINSYRLLGGAAFSRFLTSLDDTWHGTSISLRAAMFSGMALFLKTYETELDNRAFIKRLSAVDPEEIIRRSKVYFSTNNVALRYARVILEKYNAQQRTERKLPYRFKG